MSEPIGSPTPAAILDPEFKIGQTCQLTIHDLAFGGEGVGRLGEYIVFVPFVIPGERVEVELTEVKKRFARGRCIKILERSLDRVEPRCKYFGECGGCQYQHIAYSTQVRLKGKQVGDLFERVGGFDRNCVAGIVPCPAPYGYRNRIMIRTQWNKQKQGLEFGFIRTDNKWVVDIDSCAIAEPALNAEILKARSNPPPKGGLKVVLRMNPEGWVVPRDSFFQNNFHLLPQLVDGVRAALKRFGSKYLIDAYCGVGFFGLEMAAQLDGVIGVELDRPAINAARENAAKRNVHNAEFVHGQAELLLPKLLERFPVELTTLLMDPPRAGLLPGSIDAILNSGVSHVVYVSCHPATLARDLKLLCASGQYRLDRVTPYDMFPQTQHVECVAEIVRTTSDPVEKVALGDPI